MKLYELILRMWKNKVAVKKLRYYLKLYKFVVLNEIFCFKKHIKIPVDCSARFCLRAVFICARVLTLKLFGSFFDFQNWCTRRTWDQQIRRAATFPNSLANASAPRTEIPRDVTRRRNMAFGERRLSRRPFSEQTEHCGGSASNGSPWPR